MQSKFILAAVLGFISTSLAGFTPLNANLTAECTKLGPSCTIYTSATDATNPLDIKYRYSCSCQDNPNKKADLSWFYTEPNFFGYEYQAFGDYGACYNLPEAFDKQAQSFASQLPTKPDLICCLYTTWYCDEAGHDSAIVDAEHGAQDGAIKQLLGYFKNGVSSYRCALWKDGQSNCFGTGPGQKPT